MRFVVDASLPRAAAHLIRQCGHDADDVRDIGLGTAGDPLIIGRARNEGCALITADFDFADIRNYPPGDFPGIVVIDRPDGATVDIVLSLLQNLFDEPNILSALPGRLVIVGPHGMRVRPALPDGLI
jgi:predicted nuclease of predicted toxin-antitoxin system